MANILVTGCAGFIGSHLCFRLLEEGNTVVGVDNFRLGKIENLKECVQNMLLNIDFTVRIVVIANAFWIVAINITTTIRDRHPRASRKIVSKIID
mgnify:CR=1 FL=1